MNIAKSQLKAMMLKEVALKTEKMEENSRGEISRHVGAVGALMQLATQL